MSTTASHGLHSASSAPCFQTGSLAPLGDCGFFIPGGRLLDPVQTVQLLKS